MFDYMTKIRLRQYNSKKIVAVSKLEQNLTAGKVIAADRATENNQYGSYVPRIIPGSKIICLRPYIYSRTIRKS